MSEHFYFLLVMAGPPAPKAQRVPATHDHERRR